MCKVPGTENPADALTKNLREDKLKLLCDMMNVACVKGRANLGLRVKTAANMHSNSIIVT